MYRNAIPVICALLAAGTGCVALGRTPDHPLPSWTQSYLFRPPVAAADKAALPASSLVWPQFQVRPAAKGAQTVRVSVPFMPGTLAEGEGLRVRLETNDAQDYDEFKADLRVLTWFPGTPRYVRRALITFVHGFPSLAPLTFRVEGHPAPWSRGASDREAAVMADTFRGGIGATRVELREEGVRITYGQEPPLEARLTAPACSDASPATIEVIEDGRFFLWVRLLKADPQWPRIIEVRADRLGTVAVRAHLQRLLPDDGYAPDIGWEISGGDFEKLVSGAHAEAASLPAAHDFASGEPAELIGSRACLRFPDAHLLRKGALSVDAAGEAHRVTYWRSREGDRTPFQPAAWRTATFVMGPPGAAAWSPLLEPGQVVSIDASVCDALYACGAERPLEGMPELAAVRQTHRDAIASAPLTGDDFGNVTAMPASGVFGMNRLNHCPAILEEYYRSGDARLRNTALLWCNNFHDLSIWWGVTPSGDFGGARYNNAAAGSGAHKSDDAYMWRSNDAVHFCTKGFETFFYAYEETGDPRMAVALHWQTEYAKNKIHVDQGECRNIGDVLDFVRLYEFTGQPEFLDHALRLFRELRTKLSDGDLFSQGGQPIVPDPPFMDDDSVGYKHPFAKPYIIGYALQGLPALAAHAPDEPKLMDVIRAVAGFMAESQDSIGGWRYPHPKSSRVIIDQAMEHAAQLCRAARVLESRGDNIDGLLDTIERVLRARVNGCLRAGAFLTGLSGWEMAGGMLPEGKSLQDLYKKPADRDPLRDYTEGAVSVGNASPEGVVYFSEVLGFYLQRREAARLLETSSELEVVLDRVAPPAAAGEPESGLEYPAFGMENGLPAFAEAQVARMTFPLAWNPDAGEPFDAWRVRARKTLLDCLLTPPPAPAAFDPELINTEDRGAYEARKLVFRVSADCRAPAYLLVPKGRGPFPAILALHDHGAHFSIGKEKMVRPFGVSREVLDDAMRWVDECYGGRWIGDELAARGFVVLAVDALFWGERGRREGVKYDEQQTLAANLLQLGMTWSGVITWDDMRSAEFLATLPEVDARRIGATGLSMGCHRTWMLCAASDRIAAGAAICWMGTTPVLMAPGNNQTKGQSAFSMLVPNLRNFLDYPDVAAIACPRPMLFFNGSEDPLFPIPGVEAAYDRIRRVYESQGAANRLVTRIWPTPHVFNIAMQEEAFAWLDAQLKHGVQ